VCAAIEEMKNAASFTEIGRSGQKVLVRIKKRADKTGAVT
jgi:hypothetical protein